MTFKFHLLLSALLTALLLTGCSDNDDFRIIGSIENLGTQNLRVAYANESAVVTLTTTAIDGKFSFTGIAPKETMLEIFTTDRAPLGVMVVKNGQTIDVKIDRSNPYNVTLKGNKASEEISRFMRDNAATLTDGTQEEINSLIAKYVGSHPKSMASTILMLREFNAYGHEAEADSLLKSIDIKARPEYLTAGITAVLNNQARYDDSQPVDGMSLFTAGDSVMTFNPSQARASLLAFTSHTSERSDSMLTSLRHLSKKHKPAALRILDISLQSDTTRWRSDIRADSASWVQAWLPGALSNKAFNRLHLPRTPYYVVTDSTGRQIYRGQAISKAAALSEKAAAYAE